ncbi:MAG TPA: hypothetical protein VN578_06970 [Candidatus Binatia bacterium]|jgi:hypothetical protein|nr:hypothetical protein [Candidatus Binatia bacterium]
MKIPAQYPRWNKAIDGLEDPTKWVLEIERARLPSDIVFPVVGQLWEALRDCDVPFRARVAYRRPSTEAAGILKNVPLIFIPSAGGPLRGGIARLHQGERVRILELDGPRPIYVNFLPLRYHDLHESIVPEDIRKLPGYRGYELYVKTAKTLSDFPKDICHTFFNEAFRLIEDSP